MTTPESARGAQLDHPKKARCDGQGKCGVHLEPYPASGRPVVARWTAEEGCLLLSEEPLLPGYSFPRGISADGRVIVGHTENHGFRWTPEEGMIGLGDLDNGKLDSYAYAANADGSVIVGFGTLPGGSYASRWTKETGMKALYDLPGGSNRSWATAVAADGSVVVGTGTTDSGYAAFIWDPVPKMRPLAQVLTEAGADLTGWQLLFAKGISADGRVIVGDGVSPCGREEA